MANLDSRSKRASSVGLMTAFILAPPLPDGTIAQGDRQHIAYSYSGILAGAPPAPPVGTDNAVSFARQPSAAGQHARSASSVTAWGHPQLFRRPSWRLTPS